MEQLETKKIDPQLIFTKAHRQLNGIKLFFFQQVILVQVDICMENNKHQSLPPIIHKN